MERDSGNEPRRIGNVEVERLRGNRGGDPPSKGTGSDERGCTS